jgi:hypothetical protein
MTARKRSGIAARFRRYAKFGALATLGVGTGLSSSGGNLNLSLPVSSATTATNVATTSTTSNSAYYPLFVASSANSSQAAGLSTLYNVNASTGAVSSGGAIAIGTTSTDGELLTNTTAATSSAQVQYSPRLHWTGQGWKTNTTAASQTLDFIEELQPVAGAANPSGNLVISGQVNGGGYSPLMTLTTGGNVGIGSTSPQYKLDVNGNIGNAEGALGIYAGGSNQNITYNPSGIGSNVFNTTAGGNYAGGNIFYNNYAGTGPNIGSFLAPNATTTSLGNGNGPKGPSVMTRRPPTMSWSIAAAACNGRTDCWRGALGRLTSGARSNSQIRRRAKEI